MRSREVPADVSFPADLATVTRSDPHFRGFGGAAFDVLAELRATPNIETYRRLKERLHEEVQQPFKVFRDDIVVEVVLPNRLPLETERNVFSRFLKNDFGTGGSHSHLWMAFYRVGNRRLRDVQLAHSISPDGFTVGLHVTKRMEAAFEEFMDRLRTDRGRFVDLMHEVDRAGFTVTVTHRNGSRAGAGLAAGSQTDAALSAAEALGIDSRPERVSIRRQLPRAEVEEVGPGLVRWASARMKELWPLYRYMIGG